MTSPNSLPLPSMSEILNSSRAQGLHLKLQTVGPFFRVKAEGELGELGRAEGVIRPWVKGKVLHLDSIRMRRETLGMDRSIFGLGLFLGAVAVRHGFEQGCGWAELLAIDDSPVYHSKVQCQMCDQVGHIADSCPWVYSNCKNPTCHGLMRLLTSFEEPTMGKKYLECQFDVCGNSQWLEEAIREASVKTSSSKYQGTCNEWTGCFQCGQDGHWAKSCPWKDTVCPNGCVGK